MERIEIEDIAHVRFSAPDLGVMRGFLEDFGLRCAEHDDGRLYARGRDGRPFSHVTELGPPAFQGLGLRASSLESLARVAAAENGRLESLDSPGGGQLLRLSDPDGFCIEVIAGQSPGQPDVEDASPPYNTAGHRLRDGRRPASEPRPSRVMRLGHVGLGVTDLRRSERWYKDRFGLLTSDEIEIMPGELTGTFLRRDHGAAAVDHHTLVLAQFRKAPRFLHAAFEVSDLDEVMLGHAFLKGLRHTHVWGVGRHILGSQVFDYWQDPWGHELEHWTDGDQLTVDDPPGRATLEQSLASQWGSSHPGLTAARGKRS